MNAAISTIVVGVSGFGEPDPHLASAITLAGRQDAMLHVVHAYLLPELFARDFAGKAADEVAPPDPVQHGLQQRVKAEVEKLAPGARIVCHAIEGSAAQVLLDVADEVAADLIVVGAAARGPLAQALLGTTAQRVVRASKVPLLVHRNLNTRPPDRILLATDLSAVSRRVLERAIHLIAALWPSGPALRVLFVAGDDVLLPAAVHQPPLREQAEAQLDRFVASLRRARPRLERRVRLGIAARQIVAETEEWPADLLVLGTQGRHGLSRFLIGSVAESSMRNARCDILVLPGEAAPTSE